MKNISILNALRKIPNNKYYLHEEKTGEYWIDGKPIYKVVLTGTISNATTTGTIIGYISNDYETICNVSGFVGTGTQEKVQLGAYVNNNWYSGVYTSNSAIKIYGSSNTNGKTAYCIVDYTKTTDTAEGGGYLTNFLSSLFKGGEK